MSHPPPFFYCINIIIMFAPFFRLKEHTSRSTLMLMSIQQSCITFKILYSIGIILLFFVHTCISREHDWTNKYLQRANGMRPRAPFIGTTHFYVIYSRNSSKWLSYPCNYALIFHFTFLM